MVAPERPDPEQAGRKHKSSILPIFLVSLALTAGIAGAWFFFSPAPSDPTGQLVEIRPAPPPRTPPAPQVQTVLPSQSPPASHLPEQPEALPSGEHPAAPATEAKTAERQRADGYGGRDETFSPAPEGPDPAALSRQKRQCEELAGKLHAFFTHLDRKEYIRDFQLGAPTQEYFLALATKLLNNPPVVSRESDDLYTVLKNMAHFFRVIGGKNIIIIKVILDRERETIEDVAADLFQWSTGTECHEKAFPFNPQLDKLYEYAGFFLNSMGGRSYLFRRDSRSRLLVNYYAILLIDRANSDGINRHGIDIKPLLPVTISEIEGSNQLIYKEKYLDSLYGLMEKYQ